MDSVTAFLQDPEVEQSEPATVEELKAFESQTGLILPTTIRQLYERSNGLEIPGLGLKFLPLQEALKHVEGFAQWGITKRWGYFPFTDANDSNPYCICCNEPLLGRVVHVLHDDSAGLDFRNLETFLAAILKLARSDDAWIDDLAAQCDDLSDRSDEDVACGLKLIGLAENMASEEPDRNQAFIFGMHLLSNQNVAELIPLLESTTAIREAAFERLTQISTQDAREAVKEHRRKLKQFEEAAVSALRGAGINAEKVDNYNILIQPGHTWLNLRYFYDERRDPEIQKQIVDAARRFIKEKQK